jgi:hypothetical protein
LDWRLRTFDNDDPDAEQQLPFNIHHLASDWLIHQRIEIKLQYLY